MTKLSAERLAEIEELTTDISYRAAVWDTAIHDILDHIDALQAERDALARVVEIAEKDVIAFEQAIVFSGTDPEYAAIRVQPMKDALRAAGRLT